MKYKEAFEKFCTDNTVTILVETSDGNRALSEHNFVGGVCGCCRGCDDNNELEVIRVVDIETMEVFFQKEDLK